MGAGWRDLPIRCSLELSGLWSSSSLPRSNRSEFGCDRIGPSRASRTEPGAMDALPKNAQGRLHVPAVGLTGMGGGINLAGWLRQSLHFPQSLERHREQYRRSLAWVRPLVSAHSGRRSRSSRR
jgi:hypothetical protein